MIKNSILKERLEYLADLSETDFPFISLYLNIHSHNFLEQNEKNRIFIKDSFMKTKDQIKALNNKYKLKSFKNDEEKIKDYYDNKLDTRAHGLAIFACDELDVFEVFQSVLPFENSFLINSFPHLKQLAFQSEENENILAVMLDSKYAQIFDIKLGGTIIHKSDLEHVLHRFHKQGGWSQMRYQRHIQNQVASHYGEVIKVITEILDRENYNNFILIGQEHEIKNFKNILPRRIEAKIIDVEQLQMRENINEIIETIVKNLHGKEKERESNAVDDVIGKALSGGLEVLGLQDTIQVARDGKISKLITIRDYSKSGWKCGDCLHISKEEIIPGCPKCNGNTKQVDLIEELIRLTLKYNGDINIVENDSAVKLEKYDGIAAYLRY